MRCQDSTADGSSIQNAINELKLIRKWLAMGFFASCMGFILLLLCSIKFEVGLHPIFGYASLSLALVLGIGFLLVIPKLRVVIQVRNGGVENYRRCQDDAFSITSDQWEVVYKGAKSFGLNIDGWLNWQHKNNQWLNALDLAKTLDEKLVLFEEPTRTIVYKLIQSISYNKENNLVLVVVPR